jgi:hypothetical protein
MCILNLLKKPQVTVTPAREKALQTGTATCAYKSYKSAIKAIHSPTSILIGLIDRLLAVCQVIYCIDQITKKSE